MDKKIIYAAIGVVAIGGIVLGLGLTGVVKIKGLTPAKKVVTKNEKKKEEAQKAEAAKAAEDAANAAKKKDDDTLAETKKVTDALAAEKGLDASKLKVATDLDGKTISISGDLADQAQLKQAQAIVKKIAGPDFAVKDGMTAPQPDLVAGYKKVAAVWSEMTPEQVEPLMKGYTNSNDVANILKLMDADQVAKILGALSISKDATDKKQAVDLCKQLQLVASAPKAA